MNMGEVDREGREETISHSFVQMLTFTFERRQILAHFKTFYQILKQYLVTSFINENKKVPYCWTCLCFLGVFVDQLGIKSSGSQCEPSGLQEARRYFLP